MSCGGIISSKMDLDLFDHNNQGSSSRPTTTDNNNVAMMYNRYTHYKSDGSRLNTYQEMPLSMARVLSSQLAKRGMTMNQLIPLSKLKKANTPLLP